MNPAEVLSVRVRRLLLLVVLFAVIWSPSRAPAQDAPSQEKPSNAPTQPQSPAAKPAPPSAPDRERDEVKITPRQAEDLFHSVDEILEFDSKQTGLPIKREVKRKLTSRDEVVSFLTKHLNDEDTQRLRRSELVLKKFGLLPRDFNLETFLVALLREEIAGYYDPKTRTVNLLDWVPIEEQEPIMAHELTHALQDQSFGLEKWMKKGDRDLTKMKRDLTSADIETDEMNDAREAVIEGQAQAMTFQYALAPAGRSIADSPDLVDAMETETMTGTDSTKVFNDAPIFMKESLTFPYTYGMEFVVQLLRKAGKEKAFAAALRDPPHTTRQIMQPETYLSGERIEPIPLPAFKRDFKDYDKFDIGAMGEFDVAVLAEQYAGKAMSKHIYPEWRGGYYYAANHKRDPGSDVVQPLGLLYVSRWSSADAAAEFAGIYAQSLKPRYKKVEELNPAPDAAASNDPPQDPDSRNPETKNVEAKNAEVKRGEAKTAAAKIIPLKGRHAWSTEEGPVVIEQQGDTVLVSESLDAATTTTLEKEIFTSTSATK